jgi:adenylate cyclase
MFSAATGIQRRLKLEESRHPSRQLSSQTWLGAEGTVNPIDLNDPQGQTEVRAQIERILTHATFSQAKRLNSLLRYLVEQALTGRADELKEYTLGVEVFGRGTRFDPRLDSIVRVEASKLRSRLTAYYADVGIKDPIVIQLARGSYIPVITRPAALATRRQHASGAIAVLPFVNLSPDADGEYFADGMTEEVINTLGSVASLRVVSRMSAFQFKGKAGDIRDIGARLGADYVIEGSVRKSAEQLRVTAQLVEVRSGYQLWSQGYDQILTRVFAIQQEIASAICAAFGQALPTRPIANTAEPTPASMDAYRAYLRARFHRGQWTPEGATRSIEYFQKALEYQHDFVPALAGLAEAYTLRAISGDLASGFYMELARTAAVQALALNPDSAQAHLALAWIYHVYDWQWEQGDSELRHALALEPSLAEAYHLKGIVLGLRGRFREASQSFDTALQLDPLSLVIDTHAALIPYFAGHFTNAEDQLRSALSMDPHFTEAHWMLGWIYERQQRYEQALNEFRMAIQLSKQNPNLLGDMACVHGLMGDKRVARELLTTLVDACEPPHPAATNIARIHILLNEPQEASAWLGKALEARDVQLPWICGDPRYEGLWALPALRSFRQRFIASAAVSG